MAATFVSYARVVQASPGATVTVAAPGSMLAGDVVVAFLHATPSASTPVQLTLAGWTVLAAGIESPAAGVSCGVYVHTVGASEPSSYTFAVSGASSSGTVEIVLVAYRSTGGLYVDSTQPASGFVSASCAAASSTITSGAPGSVSTTSTEVIAFAMMAPAAGLSLSTPSGTTQRYATSGEAAVIKVVDLTYAGTGSSHVSTVSGSGFGGPVSVMKIVLSTATAPNVPVLTSPMPGAYLDAAGSGVGFNALYYSTDQANQNAYALRIKAAGGSYQYWNATAGALQSTIVWNPISTLGWFHGGTGNPFSVSIPPGVLTDGTTYNWSIASQEATDNLQSPFASDSTFTAQAGPTLTVYAPTGAVTSTAATVFWTTTPAPGTSQTNWRVVLYTAAQAAISGFTPGVSPSTWDSGLVTGSDQQADLGVSLSDGTYYVVYVQVTETGSVTSPWQSAAFNVTFDAPATPTVTATPGFDNAGCPVIGITIQGVDNLLPSPDGSFETGIGTWTALSNCTLAQDAAWSIDGEYSLAMTATGTDMTAGPAEVAVNVGAEYTGLATLLAANTAREVQLSLVWRDSSGTVLTTTVGTQLLDSTTAPTDYTVTGTAPTGAATVQVEVNVLSNSIGDVHYVDQVGVFPGTPTAWTTDGLAGTTVAYVTYPDPTTGDPITVRGAEGGIPLPFPGQTMTVLDVEVTPTVAREYTVTISNGTVTSAPVTVTATPTAAAGWVLSQCAAGLVFEGGYVAGVASYPGPETFPGSGVYPNGLPGGGPIDVLMSVTASSFDQAEMSAAHYALGVPLPAVIADTVGGQDGTLNVQTLDAVTYQNLATLLTSQAILWLSSPFGLGLYVRIGLPPGSTANTSGATGQPSPAHKGNLDPQTGAAQVRQLTIQYVEQSRPS